MLFHENLKESDARSLNEVAELFRNMATEAELAYEGLKPYRELYFPMTDGPSFPIEEDLMDEDYGIGHELQEWLRDSAKLLDCIAASIRTVPMVHEAMGINVGK